MDCDNPAFNFLVDNYSLNISKLSNIADLLNILAKESAMQFAKKRRHWWRKSFGPNDYLVHYFFDLYMAFNYRLFFCNNNDINDLAINGIHLKYYGQASPKIVSTKMEMRVEKEKCLLVSFIPLLKMSDYPGRLASFAEYCWLDKFPDGIFENLKLAEQIMEIITNTSSFVKNEINKIIDS